MFCKYCGSNIPDNANVCPFCGKPLVDNFQPAAPVAQNQPMPGVLPVQPAQPAKKNKKPLIIVIAVLAVVLIAIIAVIAIAAGGSDDTSDTDAYTSTDYYEEDEAEDDSSSSGPNRIIGGVTIVDNNTTGACIIDNADNATAEGMQSSYDYPVINISSLSSATRNMKYNDIVIENVQMSKGYYEGSLDFSVSGSDLVALRFKNNTGDAITNISVAFVSASDTGSAAALGNGLSIRSFNSSNIDQIADQITQFSFAEDTSIANSDTEVMAVRCDLTSFATSYAAVYSYTTSDGEEHVNPEFEDWLYSCF